jgi:hypothetical protein
MQLKILAINQPNLDCPRMLQIIKKEISGFSYCSYSSDVQILDNPKRLFNCLILLRVMTVECRQLVSCGYAIESTLFDCCRHLATLQSVPVRTGDSLQTRNGVDQFRIVDDDESKKFNAIVITVVAVFIVSQLLAEVSSCR